MCWRLNDRILVWIQKPNLSLSLNLFLFLSIFWGLLSLSVTIWLSSERVKRAWPPCVDRNRTWHMSMLCFNTHCHICAGILLVSGEQMRTDDAGSNKIKGKETLNLKKSAEDGLVHTGTKSSLAINFCGFGFVFLYHNVLSDNKPKNETDSFSPLYLFSSFLDFIEWRWPALSFNCLASSLYKTTSTLVQVQVINANCGPISKASCDANCGYNNP